MNEIIQVPKEKIAADLARIRAEHPNANFAKVRTIRVGPKIQLSGGGTVADVAAGWASTPRIGPVDPADVAYVQVMIRQKVARHRHGLKHRRQWLRAQFLRRRLSKGGNQ